MKLCAMCDLVGELPRPAVRIVLAVGIVKDDFLETPLCRRHVDEWDRWRSLVYGVASYRDGAGTSVGSA